MFSYLVRLALVALFAFENVSNATIQCKPPDMRHVVCQAFERAKNPATDCKAPFIGDAKEVENYQPDRVCEVLQRIAQSKDCFLNWESLVCPPLAAGFTLDPQAFLLKKKEELKEQKSEVKKLKLELKKRHSSLARFKKKERKTKSYAKGLGQRLDSIEEREDELGDAEEISERQVLESKILSGHILTEGEIVELFCKEKVGDLTNANIRVDLCKFSYFYVKPYFASQRQSSTADGSVGEACLNENKPNLQEQSKLMVEEGIKISKVLDALPPASTEVKALVQFLYNDDSSKRLGIPKLEGEIEKGVEVNWALLVKEVNRLKEDAKKGSQPWLELDVHSFLASHGVFHGSLIGNEIQHYFPKKIRLFSGGKIIGTYPKELGNGKDRNVVAGFDYNEALQGKPVVHGKRGLLAVATLKGDHSEHLSEKVKMFKRIYDLQGELSQAHPEIISPPELFVKYKSYESTSGVEEAVTVEDLYDGDLDHLFKVGERLPLDAEISILEQLLTLHNSGLVHRDIKPYNILFKREAGKVLPNISDYGLMKKLAHWNAEKFYGSGTPQFIPPEGPRGVLNPEGLDKAQAKKWDIWSLGLSFYALNYSKKYTHEKIKRSYGCDDAENPGTPGEIVIRLAKVKTYQDLCTICRTFCDAEGKAVTPPGTEENPSEEYMIWRMLNPDPAQRISAEKALELLKK